MNKGFFLSLISFVLLVYAVSSTVVRVNAIIQSEETYVELMKATTYETFFSNFNQRALENALMLISRHALVKMANYSAKCPIKEGHVKDVFFELVNNGSSSSSHFECGAGLDYSRKEMEATISGVADSINKSLEMQGFTLNAFTIDVSSLEQLSADTITINGTIEISISDKPKSMALSFSKNVSINVSIEGMPDPLNNRIIEDSRWIMLYYPGIRFYGNMKLPSPIPLSCNYKIRAMQGWFYGQLVNASEADSIVNKKKYIVYGTFDELSNIGWNSFGAYIILGGIEDGSAECNGIRSEAGGVPNPIKVVPASPPDNCRLETGKPTTQRPFVLLNMSKEKFLKCINVSWARSPQGVSLFFTSQVDPLRVVNNNPELKRPNYNPDGFRIYGLYGIELLRDAVKCRYYFTGEGPSFLHRMLKEPWKFDDGNKGIYTVLVEDEFTGNANMYENYSSIDYIFAEEMNEGEGNDLIVRAVSGCESKDDCLPSKCKAFIAPEQWVDEHNLNVLACEPGDELCVGR